MSDGKATVDVTVFGDLKYGRSYAQILAWCSEHPWAITRPMLQTIASILGRRVAGGTVERAEIEAAMASRRDAPPANPGGVAIIPVYGIIIPRATLFSEISGGTSFEALSAQLRDAMRDPDVDTILFDVDSPGGNVAGATEFAREVLKARATKTVVAQANYLMASGAYWLASAATEIVASPSAKVGSIGVLAIHEDLSKAIEMEGVKPTLISAGKFKTEGNDTEPLTDEARVFIQAQVDEAYDRFVADVAKGRGVPATDVRNGFGEGRAVTARKALALKMIDRVATFEETLARLTSGAPGTRAAATALSEAPDGTAQEPSPATAQDRRRASFDTHRQALALLEL